MPNRSLLFPLVSGLFSFTREATQLDVGIPAPAFRLPDQRGKIHDLGAYRGRWLVLYFYPKDDTPGCRVEACHFEQDLSRLIEMEVALLGISTDSTSSHLKFADKFQLSFPLLADVSGEVAASYGSLIKLGPLKIARRQTFVIDPEGKIAKIYRKVDPKLHSGEVIDALLKLDDSL